MKTSTKILAGLGLIGGIVGFLYLLNKRFGFGDKLKATVFNSFGIENIIGKGRSDNIPHDDTSKGTRYLQARINPHDTYKTFAGEIDSDYVVNF